MGDIVWLGNHNAVDHVRTYDENGPVLDHRGEHVLERVPLPGERVTRIQVEDGLSALDGASIIAHPQGAWAKHSDGPPEWAASTNPLLAEVLADHYGCPIRTVAEVPDAD